MDKRIKDLIPSERPYEKFRLRGETSLSDAELLSVILRCGTKGSNVEEVASNVIQLCNQKGGIGYLGRVTFKELTKLNGIGFVKAAQIKCLGELCKRMWEQHRELSKGLFNANDVAQYFDQYIKGLYKEEVWILLFDSGNHVIEKIKLSSGLIDSAVLSGREIFKYAVSYNATGFIIIHNHPSGNPKPSDEDKLITAKIYNAGLIMDIPLIDHIILADGKYYSFKEANLL